MGKNILSEKDFPVAVPAALVEALNAIDRETDRLILKAGFCSDHNFKHEADRIMGLVNQRSSIYIKICNSLGKFF